MKISLIFSFIVFYAFNVKAQDPTMEWQYLSWNFGADYNYVEQTEDGYLLAGIIEDEVSSNYAIVNAFIEKLDLNRNSQWKKEYGGHYADRMREFIKTIDGGYIFTGYTNSNDGDVNGNHGETDYWVVKINGDGDIDWSRCYGGSQQDRAVSIVQTADGNYIIAGYTKSTDGDVEGNIQSGFWIIKLDENGEITGQDLITFDSNYNLHEGGFSGSLQKTMDGGTVFGGNYRIGDYLETKSWVIKINESGEIEWHKYLEDNVIINSIKQLEDNRFIIFGEKVIIPPEQPNNITFDGYFARLDNTGNIELQKTYGGTKSDGFKNGIIDTDGKYIAGGYTYSNDGDVTGNIGENKAWVVKLDEEGNILWQGTYKSEVSEPDDPNFKHYINYITPVSGGGYLFAGGTHVNLGLFGRAWFGKLNGTLAVEDLNSNNLIAYPNPITNILYIQNSKLIEKVEVIDLTGKIILYQIINSSKGEVKFENVPSGNYIVKAYLGSSIETFKVIKK